MGIILKKHKLFCFVIVVFALTLYGQEEKVFKDIQTGLSTAYYNYEKVISEGNQDSVSKFIMPYVFNFFVTSSNASSNTLRYNYDTDTIICINTRVIMCIDDYHTFLWSSSDTIEGRFDFLGIKHRAPTRDKEFYNLLKMWDVESFVKSYTHDEMLLDGDYSYISRIIIKKGKIVDVDVKYLPYSLPLKYRRKYYI